MENNWTIKADELAREYIKFQIENNDYYENIKKAYDKDASCINAIFNCWEDFDCYYSIYKIMDAIEKFMERYNVDSVEKVVEDEKFDLAID